MSENDDVKVIKDMPRTAIIEKDGKQYWVCKRCQQAFESEKEWRAHLPRCAREHKSQEAAPEPEEEAEPEEPYTLTPEERMTLEMKEVLKRMLYTTPGVSDKKTIEWFCEQYFPSVPVLTEDPNELFRAIQRHFPKVPDDAVMLIVRSVFDVKAKYTNTGIMPPLFMPFSQQKPGYFPPHPLQQLSIQAPQHYQMDPMTLMWQMWQMMQTMMRMQPSGQDISKLVESEIERRILREEVQALRHQLKTMAQALANNQVPTEPGGWQDDYARLINNLGEKILDLGKEILKENRKIRRSLLAAIAKTAGKHKPVGEGKTDEELLDALTEVGLEVVE